VFAFLYQNGNAGDEIVQLFALSSVSSPKKKEGEREKKKQQPEAEAEAQKA